jgi:hypothetical protein
MVTSRSQAMDGVCNWENFRTYDFPPPTMKQACETVASSFLLIIQCTSAAQAASRMRLMDNR